MSDPVFWTVHITQTLASIAMAVLSADFVVGVFHWIEDAYLREDCPLLGELIARPNILHHYRPRHFLKHSWLDSCWVL